MKGESVEILLDIKDLSKMNYLPTLLVGTTNEKIDFNNQDCTLYNMFETIKQIDGIDSRTARL